MSNTITDNNKLIAEFMEIDIDEFHKLYDNERPATLKYNTSWDWLMPVVEKIEKWEDGVCSVLIMGAECDIAFSSKYNKQGDEFYTPNFRQKGISKLESTYNAAIQFINWYNNQLNKKP